MKVVVTLEDIQAYTEVDYIIHHMNKRYLEMLPMKLVNFFSQFKDPDFYVYVDPKKPLQSQGLKRFTLEIIAVLHVKYWCENEERRKELMEQMKENQRRSSEALRAKYSVDVFAKENVEVTTNSGETPDIVEKNSSEVVDFSKPQQAMVIEEVPQAEPAPEVNAPEANADNPENPEGTAEGQNKEEQEPENIDFRKIDPNQTASSKDIASLSASIDGLPIDKEKLSFFQKILNFFRKKK
jgi:hypothetical protein